MPPKKVPKNITSALLDRQQQGGRFSKAVRDSTVRKQQADRLAELVRRRRQRFIDEWLRTHPGVVHRFGEHAAVNFAIQAWVQMRREEERAQQDPTAVPAYVRGLLGGRGTGVDVD